MKLVFDARYIRPDAPDGIGRYTKQLAWAATQTVPPGWSLSFLIHDEAQRAALPPGADVVMFSAPTSWREPFAGRALNRLHPHVVFSPMQTLGTAGRRYRTILTLHDLIYYRHRTPPRDLAQIIRLGWRLFYATYLPQRLTLNAADAVCTVSQTSKRQILAARLTKRPVVVVPNAPAALPVDAVRPGPDDVVNLVYMGSFMGYKDVETLVRAAARLGRGYRLHLLSRIADQRREQLEAVAPAANLVFHGGVSDERYAQLLGDRAILVTASLDEGYGLPVAEALAAGVPAVVTDLEIFHEVAGDGALYFPAGDVDAVVQQVLALRNAEEWEHHVEAGRAHIARFSWSSSARELWREVDRLGRGQTSTPSVPMSPNA